MGFEFSNLFGTARGRRLPEVAPIEHVQLQRPMQRLMDFTGMSIDDIVNCPIAKRSVLGYYKLHRWVERQSEVTELERQWNNIR
ncbi:MAG TPA: hypothetical protein PLD59_15035 [Tepidisphaeraceae bacterium]|nr:hypothetical protein [Tepidisphaeraceae bacterium]